MLSTVPGTWELLQLFLYVTITPPHPITIKAKRVYLKYLASDNTKIHHMIHRLALGHVQMLCSTQLPHNTPTRSTEHRQTPKPDATHKTQLYHSQEICYTVHRLAPSYTTSSHNIHMHNTQTHPTRHRPTTHHNTQTHMHAPYNSVMCPVSHQHTLPHSDFCFIMCGYIF